MTSILDSRKIKDAIGVFFVAITGLLYATGVTEAATEVTCEVGSDQSAVEAEVVEPSGDSEVRLG